MLVIGGSTPFGRTLNDVWSMSMTTAPYMVSGGGRWHSTRSSSMGLRYLRPRSRDRVLVYGGLDLLDQEVCVLSLAGSPT